MPFFKSNESLGIFFAIFAYLNFSILDAIQKTAVIHHSIFQLLLIKYSFVLILSYFESRRKSSYKFYKSKNIKLQIIRSILSIIESSCFVLAFRYLSLADAHSIASLTPIIVVGMSAIFLKEYVSPKTWIAIFIGFVGVVIIMRPGLSIFDSKSLKLINKKSGKIRKIDVIEFFLKYLKNIKEIKVSKILLNKKIRLTLDYKEDLKFFRAIYKKVSILNLLLDV